MEEKRAIQSLKIFSSKSAQESFKRGFEAGHRVATEARNRREQEIASLENLSKIT